MCHVNRDQEPPAGCRLSAPDVPGSQPVSTNPRPLINAEDIIDQLLNLLVEVS
jgi:hypothetical protein